MPDESDAYSASDDMQAGADNIRSAAMHLNRAAATLAREPEKQSRVMTALTGLAIATQAMESARAVTVIDEPEALPVYDAFRRVFTPQL